MKSKGKLITDLSGEQLTTVVGGLAWCGIYQDRELGFVGPHFVSHYPNSLDEEQRKVLTKGNRTYYPSDMYRVRVSIEPVLNKNGRFIVKRNPNRKSQ